MSCLKFFENFFFKNLCIKSFYNIFNEEPQKWLFNKVNKILKKVVTFVSNIVFTLGHEIPVLNQILQRLAVCFKV